MTIEQAFPEHHEHPRWLMVAAVIWLLLVSAVAIVSSVGLSHLAEQIRSTPRDSAQQSQVNALSARVIELEQRVNAYRQQPAPLSQADFMAARQVLDDKMMHLEQALSARALTDDLQALQARVSAIETRQEKSRRQAASTTVQRSPAETKPNPKVPEPPFQVLGVELRGGERFLSITAPAATSIVGARLLREGDTEGGWRLQSIEARVAVFQINGQTQRVAVP